MSFSTDVTFEDPIETDTGFLDAVDVDDGLQSARHWCDHCDCAHFYGPQHG